MVGHVDSGKSTLCGRLLFESGILSDEYLARLKQEAAELGKESFSFAFAMDKCKDERARDVSIHWKTRELSVEPYNYTMIDAPGHRDFIKNMISGASQADVALLMVPANKGYYGFETSIAKGNHKKGQIQGQTRQHARLCHLLGIEQMIVGINKMDDKSVNWSQDRYNEIKGEVGKMLTKIGYKTKKIPFIPISGFKGDNIMARSENMNWWKGFQVKIRKKKISGITLLDALEKVIKPPKRVGIAYLKMDCLISGYYGNKNKSIHLPQDIINLLIGMVQIYQKPFYKPLIMPVAKVCKIKGVGDVIVGRIEQGGIMPGVIVKFLPTGCIGTVFSIQTKGGRPIEHAICGDNIGVNVKRLPKENMPRKGDIMVIADKKLDPNPPRIVSKFTALVFVQDHPGKLSYCKKVRNRKTGGYCFRGGFTPSIHVRTARAPCQMIAIN